MSAKTRRSVTYKAYYKEEEEEDNKEKKKKTTHLYSRYEIKMLVADARES